MSQPELKTDARGAAPAPASATAAAAPVATGIGPLDERVGGLQSGGSYLVTGLPGPVKLVAGLHFLKAGLDSGEAVGALTSVSPDELLRMSASWGIPLEAAWRDGRLRLAGFREEFELRATRSVTPDEVMDELDELFGPGLSRIVVDPGMLFLSGGARTLLGSAYLRWTRDHPATVYTTLSLDGDGATLPASADWLLHATSGRLVVERRSGELYQVTLVPAVPTGQEKVEPVSLVLAPGAGLRKPDRFPSRREDDRGQVDPGRLLLVILGDGDPAELVGWARAGFETTVARSVPDGVEAVQRDPNFGAVLVYAPRARVRDARQMLRTVRPLTRSALAFASDDDIRATDRIHMLEAGADECLTDGIDLPELDLRIRQAVRSCARALPPELRNDGDSSVDHPRGRVAPSDFRQEAERRASRPVDNVFCVVRISSSSGGTDRLGEVLAEEIRDDDGDLLTRLGDAHLLLLQGARSHQTRPFLARVRSRLSSGADDLSVEVLSHPADGGSVRALLEDVGGEAG